MGSLLSDVRYGLRTLLKSPGFTVVAVLALALGVGANTAIFSVVNTVLLQPLPFADSGQIVIIKGRDEKQGTTYDEHSYPNFLDLRNQAQGFANVVAYSGATLFMTGGGEPERVRGLVASADLFPLLGVQPAVGRVYTREEDQPGQKRMIVLSHELWQRRFSGDPQIIGQDIALGSNAATVTGVMPPGFKFPVGSQAECWMALGPTLSANSVQGRGAVYLDMAARLKPGVTLAQGQVEAATIAQRLAGQYPRTNANQSLALVPMHENLVGNLRPALLVLLGAVGLVLLIACANVANLLLVRASGRQKEIAVRSALGASRWRIVRQLLIESLLLALAGGALGLLFAVWGVEALVAASPADIPRVGEVGLEARVLGFTVAVTLLTGIVFGLVPAWQASKADLNESLKEGGRGSTEGAGRNRLRGALVVAEVALSLVLLVGAGLLIQSFWNLLNVSPGFEPRRVLAADVVTLNQKYPEAAQQANFFREVLDGVAALPGVEAVGAIYPLPFGGSFEAYTFQIEGRPPAAPNEAPVADFRVVTSDYFRAMSIPLARGRAFDERDGKDAPPVVIINESFARQHFAGEDPLGKRITFGSSGNPTREIVGVVGDVRHAGLDEATNPEYYVSYLQNPISRMTVVTRAASSDPAALAPSIRGAIRQVNSGQPVYNVRTMDQLLAQSLARRRFNMILLGVFAGLALALAAIGLYGVMSYTVAQRTHEIGIRLALGAQKGDVLRLVVGQGLLLAVVGVGLGLAVAFAATRLLATLLYGVSATSVTVFASVSLLLLLVALLACYVPARRATRVDPMIALRYE